MVFFEKRTFFKKNLFQKIFFNKFQKHFSKKFKPMSLGLPPKIHFKNFCIFAFAPKARAKFLDFGASDPIGGS